MPHHKCKHHSSSSSSSCEKCSSSSSSSSSSSCSSSSSSSSSSYVCVKPCHKKKHYKSSSSSSWLTDDCTTLSSSKCEETDSCTSVVKVVEKKYPKTLCIDKLVVDEVIFTDNPPYVNCCFEKCTPTCLETGLNYTSNYPALTFPLVQIVPLPCSALYSTSLNSQYLRPVTALSAPLISNANTFPVTVRATISTLAGQTLATNTVVVPAGGSAQVPVTFSGPLDTRQTLVFTVAPVAPDTAAGLTYVPSSTLSDVIVVVPPVVPPCNKPCKPCYGADTSYEVKHYRKPYHKKC